MNRKNIAAQINYSLKKGVRFLIVVLSIYLAYLIIYGGQYSVASYFQAKKFNQNAIVRNEQQIVENNNLAEENYKLQTDKELQIELSKELGYMQKGEQIIKRSN